MIPYYFTTTLEFPDGDVWVKQREIPGRQHRAIDFFIDTLSITDPARHDLKKLKRHRWKDNQGVWVTLQIESTKRNDKWGGR